MRATSSAGGSCSPLRNCHVARERGRSAVTTCTDASIAALRETSVLFATLIGTLLLGERFGPRRIVAAALVVVGLLAMNLPLAR